MIIFTTIFGMLWTISNAYFNYRMIEGLDWHKAQSLQFLITALAISSAMYMGLEFDIDSLILCTLSILSYRMLLFDTILNSMRGLAWDYKLWIPLSAKVALFGIINFGTWYIS